MSSMQMTGWSELTEKGRMAEAKAGAGDAFKEAKSSIERMATKSDFGLLPNLLKKRAAARALTQIWMEDSQLGRLLFNQTLIEYLISAQRPRLGRLALLNLITIFFQRFDELDKPKVNEDDVSLFSLVSQVIKNQLGLFPNRDDGANDVLQALGQNSNWIFSIVGPKNVVTKAISSGEDLDAYLEKVGIKDIVKGRFGDICRSHYYLQTLKEIPVGSDHQVVTELQKSSVYKSPYQDDKTIGVAALEIIIDRSTEAPGELWENFVLKLAGDPRISSTAQLFREWWIPLGEERVQKVRGWLAKADLKLFLRALEEYGIQSGNIEVQRMYPARKLFLEGLLKQGIIRNSRLMLGFKAASFVQRILEDDQLNSYVELTGELRDKSVIYLDCGDFHLIEGSHSFKLWGYLAQPSLVTDYSITRMNHTQLTKVIPIDYRRNNPGLRYIDVTHNSQWQSKIINFLAENGIGLELEKLFTPKQYTSYKRKHGIPVVRQRRQSPGIAPPSSIIR